MRHEAQGDPETEVTACEKDRVGAKHDRGTNRSDDVYVTGGR